MKEPEPIGYIGREGRTLYFVLEADNEAYIVHSADFNQFLTQKAIKGCKASEIKPEDE
jgi:hypothetical protein